MLVSILGDSISTFEGCQPEGNAVFYNQEKQVINGITSVNDMWWARVIKGIHGELCMNNAYSGSKVAGERTSAGCSAERTSRLHAGQNRPDVILVYLGTNDFGYGVPLRDERRKLFKELDVRYFESAYDCMLRRLRKNYGRAKIICGTLMKTTLREHEDWSFPERLGGIEFEEYNKIIRTVVRKRRCILADAGALNKPYETLDGFHPTVRGHATIAENWLGCL